MTSIPYRTEIDGLRAIAVLAVVLYHARLGPSAGYVGVDIFFVISGYLITALLYKEWIADGRISLLGFYARRVRRLFAALAVVVAATVGASWFLLSPFGEQRQLAQSAAASLVFVGNLYFQTHTGGYFSGTSDLLPLLHLWSLGVEEQFYLLWPMLLILVLRLRPKWLYPAVLMTSLASLAVAEILIRDNPQAAFYQMPARFWELGIGGLIALRPAGRLLDGRAPAYAALVVMAVAVSVPFTHFPGLGALPAVASAALLLYAVHGSDELGLIGTFLRSRAMVFFGLISYSLYLWHWPLLAVDRVMRIGGSPLGVRAGLVLVAILLAWLSYRFVEQPFRRADLKATPTKIVTAAVLAYVSLAYCSLVIGDFLYRVPIPNDLA